MTNDGGPAFPCSFKRNDRDVTNRKGMSLRDWFAGMALRGIEIEEQADLVYSAKEAYMVADAMLEERANKEDGQ